MGEDFEYNYQLLRERDDELDRIEKELDKKNQVILSLTKNIEHYKQQNEAEKNQNINNQQLLNKANEQIEIIKKEQEIKLNDVKFEYSQKLESLQTQNTQKQTQLQQLRELVEKLKAQNQTEKNSNQDLGKKYEEKLDDLVGKLSNVQDEFEKEKRTNTVRIEEYIKTIQQKNTYCLNLEKNVNALNQKLATKQKEYNELYFGLKQRDKQINKINSHNMETENVLSAKDTKIQRLEKDLQEMYTNKYAMNDEKKQLNDKLIVSTKEIEKLNEKIQRMSNQLIGTQQNKTKLIDELTENNQILKTENETLKRQNRDIRNVTKEMKLAITQLHGLSMMDKKNNGMDLFEMQCLIEENEKLKKQLNSVKGKLKEKERELLLIKREKTRLHEISNRYHHELNLNKTMQEFQHDDVENNYIEHDEDDDDDTRTHLKTQNDKLFKKIKALQTSLTSSVQTTKSSLNRTTRSAPIPTSKPSKHSIRTKYDEVRKKLNSMNDTKHKTRSKQHHFVRNWNHR